MDDCEEVTEEQREEEEQREDEQQPCDQTGPATGNQDQEEKPTEGQDNGDGWDTDLEPDNDTQQNQSLTRSQQYLQACRWTGTVPVSSFLRHLGEADLNLNHYGVGPLGAKALAIALQNDTDVTNLELEDNALQAEGTQYLMEMLETNTTIQSLNLSNNQLHLEGAKSISKMLSHNCYITSIKLSGNDFDDSAAECLADALKRNCVLKELDLSHNKICGAGQNLGDMLATNVGLEVLNLSWNRLCKDSAVALSAGLKGNSTLKQLQLSRNSLGRVEAGSLGDVLKHNSTLVLLDLSSNLIDDQAAALLHPGLATNATLRVLKLSHNPLTNIGALSLLKTVTENKNSAVEEMDLSTVFVRETFVELLGEARQRRPGLDVRHSVMSSVTRNISALQVFQKFLSERNESIMDFFQVLDKDGTKTVPTSAFRRAVKEANVPLDKWQLDWLIKKFDENCTATIIYSRFAELS